MFPGFRPALEACYLTWDSYPIYGVTWSESSRKYHCPFMCFRHSDGHSRSGETGMIHSSHAILNNPAGEHHLLHSSATICSIPLVSAKRPRSVDFGVERGAGAPEAPNRNLTVPSNHSNPGPSTSAGPTAGPSKPGKSSKGRKQKGNNNNNNTSGNTSSAPGVIAGELLLSEAIGGERPVVPSGKSVSASGLKIKVCRDASFEQSSSFDEDVAVPSGSSSSSGNEKISSGDGPSTSSEAVLSLTSGARNGNRSSVSSEGFCDNENDADLLEADNDEGVEADAKVRSSASQTMSLNNTGTSDDLEGDGEADLDGDSDSSLSARDPAAVRVPGPSAAVAGVVPKFDSSDSQQSGDEYQLYYYDPKAPVGPSKRGDGTDDANASKKDAAWNVFANLRRIEDQWEVLFARAEGLHAHGHSQEAGKLGARLAEELLDNPPNLSIDLPLSVVGKGKRKKVNPLSHQISCLASATLAKCSFLCTVLAENSDHFCLAFQVGMFGLELARPPASTKPLEVKLANQEAELAQLLKRILIGQKELDMIRLKAQTLKDGTFKSRGEALLPLVLANFIFDALVMPSNREGRCNLQTGVYHLASDESLGFEAAVSALGLKANVSEADHPLLCEGTRRQRGDLALSMLLHYKDEPDKLAKIMEKLLDREIHQLYKAPLPSAYYSNNPPTTTLLGSAWNTSSGKGEETNSLSPRDNSPSGSSPSAVSSNGNSSSSHNGPKEGGSSSSSTCSSNICVAKADSASSSNDAAGPSNQAGGNSASATRSDSDETSGAQSNGTGSNSGGATPQQSGNSVGATSTQPIQSASTNAGVSQTSGRSGKESVRFKGKRSYPVLPNQPSEAGAHFMFELAKIVLGKAGGSSNQSLFTQPSNGQNPRGPHRALHMCAFHIGLYALGLHNAVSPNWLSRTYSSHVSWITGNGDF